jgi:hypothetical protein
MGSRTSLGTRDVASARMHSIDSYREVVDGSAADFVRRHPHPFVIHAGGPLRGIDRSKTRGLTVDRLVLEGKPRAAPHEGFLAAPVVCRDPVDTLITIGVSSTCDIVIDDASLSKQHAWFDCVNGSWRIWDNESAAGTLVNDEPVQRAMPRTLRTGDKITLGFVDLTFLTNDAFFQLLRGLLR